jgi:hypothetical protein
VPGVAGPAALSARVLTRAELGRALLARNLLLERASPGPAEAVGHLVAVQAQEPQEPYVGLWSRVAGFDPDAASRLLDERALVRTHLMRRTVHLVTSGDALGLRALHQPMLDQRGRPALGTVPQDVDLDEVRAMTRERLHAAPLRMGEVAREVATRFPGLETAYLASWLQTALPLVQVPPRGRWREDGPAACTTFEAWLGADPEPLEGEAVVERAATLVLRYLAAFGPAATADVRAWCGVAGLPAAVKRLAPDLVTYRDERGRTLIDLPGAPLPDARVPAPPRFLPAFDNAVLGYDDRSRVIDDEHRPLSVAGARYLLVDGRVAATWTTAVADDRTTLAVTALGAPVRSPEVEAEAEELVAFLAPPGTATTVRWLSGS